MTPLTSRQRLWLAGIATLAAYLRFGGVDAQSLSHFDEGVYVTSAATVANGGLYSFAFAQPLQSPPLFPWMIAGLMQATQSVWPGLGIVVAATLGTASVPLFFLLARRWGGNAFGLVAAGMLSIGDFHVAYSRMALTDAPLTFWFLLAMYCVARLIEAFERPAGAARDLSKKKGQPAKKVEPLAPRGPAVALWTVGVALAGAAAWNTKYNGWLAFAIVLAAVAAAVARAWLLPSRWTAETRVPAAMGARLAACLLAATAAAGVCYLPWYLYVERNFAGGYRAVLENHRSYFHGLAAWPRSAWRLIETLPALRHWGWAISLVAMPAAIAAVVRQRRHVAASRVDLPLQLGGLLLATAAVTIYGADAVVLAMAPLAVVWCVAAGGWGRLLPAAWCGAFVVLAPLYHPYPRLAVPAVPAAICVVLWLARDAWGWLAPPANSQPAGPLPANGAPRLGAQLAFAAGTAAAACVAVAVHPFGWVPSQQIWNRWTSRDSYRALQTALLEQTDREAVVISQGQPVMTMYCPRRLLIVENGSFADKLADVPADRDCYLAVDHFWLHQPGDAAALAGLRERLGSLSPVAVIDNDLNIVSLLDQLSPREVVDKLADERPEYELLGADGQAKPAPPPLAAPYRDTIVVYRVERSGPRPGGRANRARAAPAIPPGGASR